MGMTTLSADRANARTGFLAASVAVAMVGVGFAAVPLYRLFCQVTGFDGTTMRVSAAQAATVEAIDKTVVVRFDANQRGLPWEFRPEHPTDTVSIGARDMSIFIAKNLSSEPITGTATFNVTPALAGKYFNKIQCFCLCGACCAYCWTPEGGVNPGCAAVRLRRPVAV